MLPMDDVIRDETCNMNQLQSAAEDEPMFYPLLVQQTRTVSALTWLKEHFQVIAVDRNPSTSHIPTEDKRKRELL